MIIRRRYYDNSFCSLSVTYLVRKAYCNTRLRIYLFGNTFLGKLLGNNYDRCSYMYVNQSNRNDDVK